MEQTDEFRVPRATEDQHLVHVLNIHYSQFAQDACRIAKPNSTFNVKELVRRSIVAKLFADFPNIEIAVSPVSKDADDFTFKIVVNDKYQWSGSNWAGHRYLGNVTVEMQDDKINTIEFSNRNTESVLLKRDLSSWLREKRLAGVIKTHWKAAIQQEERTITVDPTKVLAKEVPSLFFSHLRHNHYSYVVSKQGNDCRIELFLPGVLGQPSVAIGSMTLCNFDDEYNAEEQGAEIVFSNATIRCMVLERKSFDEARVALHEAQKSTVSSRENDGLIIEKGILAIDDFLRRDPPPNDFMCSKKPQDFAGTPLGLALHSVAKSVSSLPDALYTFTVRDELHSLADEQFSGGKFTTTAQKAAVVFGVVLGLALVALAIGLTYYPATIYEITYYPFWLFDNVYKLGQNFLLPVWPFVVDATCAMLGAWVLMAAACGIWRLFNRHGQAE